VPPTPSVSGRAIFDDKAPLEANGETEGACANGRGSSEIALYLRKVIHHQAHDNLKLDGSEVEIGSIGIQHGAAWRWGIDTVIPMRVLETQGKGKDPSARERVRSRRRAGCNVRRAADAAGAF